MRASACGATMPLPSPTPVSDASLVPPRRGRHGRARALARFRARVRVVVGGGAGVAGVRTRFVDVDAHAQAPGAEHDREVRRQYRHVRPPAWTTAGRWRRPARPRSRTHLTHPPTTSPVLSTTSLASPRRPAMPLG